MPSRYLYFRIDDRDRIVELRVTRRSEADGEPPGVRYGRSMTRDLSGEFLRLDDLPASYEQPIREHVGRTGERQGVVAVPDEPRGSGTEGGRGAEPGISSDTEGEAP